MNAEQSIRTIPARQDRLNDWQHWAPYAAIVWSLAYAAIGVYWAVSGRGFPYSSVNASDIMEPLLGRFGSGVAWAIVILAGFPAAVIGMAMQRGVKGKVLRPLLITAGALLIGILLLLMTSLSLLVDLGYFPLMVINIIQGTERGQNYFEGLTQWKMAHQLLCMVGGFLWLAATFCYTRRSVNACLYCGRKDGTQGWTSPSEAARWGRIAVYVAMVVPVFYALTRYAWALGFPLGMDAERFRINQEAGIYLVGALSHGNLMLFGAVLMLGLVQRWGEVFPRWMIGLAGRKVPIALAVVPALLISVLLLVGGIGIWSGIGTMRANLAAMNADTTEVTGAFLFELGPTLLFPLWGVALMVATLGYYYRRRGPCNVCGRGEPIETSETLVIQPAIG